MTEQQIWKDLGSWMVGDLDDSPLEPEQLELPLKGRSNEN